MKNQNRIPMISRLLALLLALAFGAQSLDAACYHVECRLGLSSTACSCTLYTCSAKTGRTSNYITCVGGWGQYPVCRNHEIEVGTASECHTRYSLAGISNCLLAAGAAGAPCVACLKNGSVKACLACFGGLAATVSSCVPCGNIVLCVAGAPRPEKVMALEIVEAGGECPKTPTPCDPI